MCCPMAKRIDTPVGAAQICEATRALPAGDGYTENLKGAFEPAITRRPPGAAPMSFAQQQIWVHAQLAPGAPLYNEVLVLERTGPLDQTALEKSFREIIRRHETLRTIFPPGEGVPDQVIAEHKPLELPPTELKGLPDHCRRAEVLRIVTEEARRPFDLARGPLIRVRLLRLSPENFILLVTVHTIIADECSLKILGRELGELYEAYSHDKPSPLSDLAIQYADFAYWQRNWFQGDLLEQQISYWRDRLAEIPSVLELPMDRTRPPIQRFRGARQTLGLSKRLTESLKKLSEQERVTLFMTLLAAFQALLSRYAGQEDILVGSILPGRDKFGTQGLIGLFAHAVINRADLSGDPTFRQLVRRVNGSAQEDCRHQNVALDRLVTELQPQRDLSRNPIFQVLFSLAPSMSLAQSGWNAAELEADSGASKADLQLQLYDRSEGIFARFTYSTDLFDATTINQMAMHFNNLLESIVANPDQRILRLPMLTQTEKHQLLVEWNATQTDYPRDRSIHQLFEAQLERAPDAIAVMFENNNFTYRELNRRANQLAHYLQKLGVSPDVLVGICVERSIEMVVALLGILKAGGAYVPLDPAYPPERLSFMLKDAEVSVLLTQKRLVPSLPENGARVVCLDVEWRDIARESTENLACEVKSESLAYVIYTSGSTGKPKGVQITHRAVVNFLNSMSQTPGIGSADRLLAVTTLSFDIAGLEIYLPLSVGASLEIASQEVCSDGGQLRSKLATSGTTVLQATPATWRMLLESGWEGDHHLKALCGGEALSRKLADQLLQKVGSLWNMYGPTETTIWSTTCKVRPTPGAVPMGKPIANTQIFILDKGLQPTPIGVAGELYIGGAGLARGYLKRPELTAEKFVDDPFGQDPGSRLYKTGDLVRYMPDGEIEFLGRIDHQTKIRGFRVELGEIEAALRQHRAVNETVVVVREDVPGDQRLTAYLVPTKGSTPTVGELRDFLKGKLPAYMVPSAFVTLSAMPLTANGKVNRLALPLPKQPDSMSQKSITAATDVLESQLVKIWESILRVRPIGIRDNFFDLGGHSLLAVRIMHRVEQICGKALPIAMFFQAPTIEQLARILRQKGWSPTWCSLVAIQTGGSKVPFFCVHGASANVIRFHDLARYLGSDQPFYGLQAQGLNPKHSCHTRVEDMAAHYIKEIGSVQPEGPYFLGGYSFGGMIAFEIAQQLINEGREPPLVVLFDTFCTPQPGTHISADIAVFCKSISSSFGTLLRSVGAERRAYLSRIAMALKRGIRRRLRRLTLPRTVKMVQRGCRQAARAYVLRPYPGRVILFRSSEKPLTQFRDPHIGWTAYVTRRLEIREIDGDHENILLEPQVRFVAKQLKECLDEAQARPTAG